MNRLAILDCTVLSNYALVGRADLAISLWGESTCTTSAAIGEYLSATDKNAFPTEFWGNLPVLALTDQEELLSSQLPARLGAGERACIAVGIARSGIFVSDDFVARRIAKELGLSLSGTLGILIGCVKRDLLTLQEANRLLTRMMDAGYHAPVDHIDGLVR